MNKLSVTVLSFLCASGFSDAGDRQPPTTATAAEATLYPIPNLTGSFWERERLLGDLGGPRQTLAERGVQIDFNMTHTYQGVFDGGESQGWSQRVSDSLADAVQDQLTRGLLRLEDSKTVFGRVLTQPIRRRGDITLGAVLQERINRLDFGGAPPGDVDDAEYQGTWRLELKLDTAKMGLWPGGFIFMRAEQNYGRDINARSGAVIPPNENSTLPLPGLDGVTIPHLTITQFLSEHIALSVGKLDPTGGDANEFAHIVGDDRFLGSAFACNPVVALTAPYSALGAALLILPAKDFVLALSAIDTEGIATRSGFDTVWEGRTTYLAEGRLTTHIGGKVGHQLLGLVYASGEFAEFEQPLRAFVPGSGVSPSRADETWAIYYNFDQYLWNPTVTTDSKGGSQIDPTHGVGIFGRVGFADESTSAIAQFYSFGAGGRGLGATRPNDRWGIGWYYMKTSRDLPDFLHLGDEQGVEAFYNFAVTPACMITADLQVTDSAKEGIGTAVIGGLRATLRF
jgi:porin